MILPWPVWRSAADWDNPRSGEKPALRKSYIAYRKFCRLKLLDFPLLSLRRVV